LFADTRRVTFGYRIGSSLAGSRMACAASTPCAKAPSHRRRGIDIIHVGVWSGVGC
jgi:hypothetical protein